MALKFEGAAWFRQRVVLATLSHKSIVIRNIRALDEQPGLKDFEASLLRLIEKITNGSKIEIDETGSSLVYRPGIIVGGKVKHDCGTSRSIGYFLEALVLIAPFAKSNLFATLTGITNGIDGLDIGVDAFRTVTLPNLKVFGVSDALEFKIAKRGAPPTGGGEVIFRCPVVKQLIPIDFVDPGRIKRVRGVCYTTRMNPSFASRVVDSVKGKLLELVSDVFIYTDHYKGPESGQSPGYGLTLVAESTSGAFMSAELMAEKQTLPEDLGENCVNLLLQEILRGGCVDTANQSILLTLMALGPEDLTRLRVGKLSEYTISYLRHIKEFFGVSFQLSPDAETGTVLIQGFGSNFLNLAKSAI